jgi:hypothetical protein
VDYEFHMTPERARAAVPTLEAVLWFQNERLYHDLRARMPWRRQLRTVGLVLAAGGFGLALLGALFAPYLRLAFIATLVAFALFIILFHRGEEIERAMRRGTRRIVARRAQRLLAPALRYAPYAIAYTLEADRLAIQASGPSLPRAAGRQAEIPLSRVRLAIVAPGFIGLFARPLAQRPLRLVYVPTPTEQALLETALTVNQAEVMTLA